MARDPAASIEQQETGGVEPNMQVPVLITVIIAVATGLACLVAGVVIGYQRRKSYAERRNWA